MTSPARHGSRRRRPVLVPATGLLAAAALLLTAVLGGFREAPEPGPEQRQAGEDVDQDVFRTVIEDAVAHTVPGSGDQERPVLDLNLKVYNDAGSSVPLRFLDDSLLRVAGRQGERLLDPAARANGGGWMYDLTVPGEGAPSRLLPPKRTSEVLLRFRLPASAEPKPGQTWAGSFPSLLDIDLGLYENHEDPLTGRRRAKLVEEDDGAPAIAARVTVPVRKAV
ncbi:hypothetical protein Skr01_73860 [Sphaerisporangium krabiense]|uniref:Uncharacterized protein n=1 Tax=Sphaerisporangium krabiense TaxID=763782 RepID=A0A7W8Z0F8_9ACTN|nr:hypothetical protein [Sphaerisporangium krabiense]MBB5625100.1 hypothetical protein [Sphaerisporangium krabiense]GII67301.1 hypothetical protein Skr01_73860 [Sphaerisporangium krabiense]